MFQEHFVDFPRREFLATAVDDLLLATDENQVSVVIEKTVIPRLEPIANKRGLVRHRVAVVPRHDTRASDDDLPRLPSGQQCPPSSMIATSKPTGTPADPTLRRPGGSGLQAIAEEPVSVIP